MSSKLITRRMVLKGTAAAGAAALLAGCTGAVTPATEQQPQATAAAAVHTG